jgi:hypothetical protein
MITGKSTTTGLWCFNMRVNTIVLSDISYKVFATLDSRYYYNSFNGMGPLWVHELSCVKNYHDLGRCFAPMVF